MLKAVIDPLALGPVAHGNSNHAGQGLDTASCSCTACIAGAVAAAEELQGFVCRVPLPEQAISTAAVYEDASLPEALRQQVRGAALHDH